MVNNHEIKIKVSKEVFDAVKKLHNTRFSEYRRSFVQQQIFLKGLKVLTAELFGKLDGQPIGE